MLNFNLTPEQIALRERAQAFALSEILPAAWYYEERDETPLHVLQKAHAAGLMSTDIPVRYGGQGHGLLDVVLIVEETSAACAGIATSIFDNSLGLAPLLFTDNQYLKDLYLPRLAKEFKLMCFATSEPLAGSDVAGIRCEAQEKDDGYVLNGTKYWVTNGGIADYLCAFATVDPGKGHGGIGGFLVPLDAEGVSVSRPLPKLGQRASNTAGIHFQNVRVPRDHVIAPFGEGFVLAMKTFERTRPAIAAFAVGAARSAMEFAVDYAKKRRAFGTTLGNFQATQFKLAEMYQKVETSRLLTWKAAWEVDQGMDASTSASIAKMYATETAWEVVSDSMQIFGGYGYTRMFPVEKLLRDIRLLKIYEGTSEIQRIVLAGKVMNSYTPIMPPLEDLPVLGRHSPGEALQMAEGGIFAWRCRICGNVHYGEEPPDHCPYCFFPKASFKKVYPK